MSVVCGEEKDDVESFFSKCLLVAPRSFFLSLVLFFFKYLRPASDAASPAAKAATSITLADVPGEGDMEPKREESKERGVKREK